MPSCESSKIEALVLVSISLLIETPTPPEPARAFLCRFVRLLANHLNPGMSNMVSGFKCVFRKTNNVQFFMFLAPAVTVGELSSRRHRR